MHWWLLITHNLADCTSFQVCVGMYCTGCLINTFLTFLLALLTKHLRRCAGPFKRGKKHQNKCVYMKNWHENERRCRGHHISVFIVFTGSASVISITCCFGWLVFCHCFWKFGNNYRWQIESGDEYEEKHNRISKLKWPEGGAVAHKAHCGWSQSCSQHSRPKVILVVFCLNCLCSYFFLRHHVSLIIISM